MEKLYTVKEIADLLSVSKPTIQRYINTAAIEPDKEENQCRYYSYDKAVEIIKAVNAEFDISRIAADHEAPQNDAPQTATPPQNAEIEILKSVIATIQEQLVIKDKQIANMDRQIAAYEDQITNYSKRLKEALELTKGQQYIAAADKTAQIMDKESAGKENINAAATDETITAAADLEEVKTEKKSFWKRLFR